MYSNLKEVFENQTKISFYIEGTIELCRYISQLKEISDKNILEVKLKYFYHPPELLIDPDNDLRNDFLQKPHHDHEIFKSIKYRLEIIENIRSSLKDKNEQIEGILNGLASGYTGSIDYFVKEASSGSKIFNEKIIVLTEDLKFREIALEKAYQISSYNKEQLKFIKTNNNGISYVTKDDGVFYKSDYGLELGSKLYLRPLMEFTIKSFYSSVLRLNRYSVISPTQLIVIWGLPIFDETSNEKIEFDSIKSLFGIKCDKEAIKLLPHLKNTISNGFKLRRPIILQANLLQEGGTLDDILNLQSDKCTDNCSSLRMFYDKLTELSKVESFMYSFSAHIIGGLLLLTSDVKSDNLIFNEQSRLIIGIDNDRFMDQEIKRGKNGKHYMKFKNVLFTIRGLMIEPVNREVRECILNINPYELILGWLLEIYNQELLYNELFQKFFYLNNNYNKNDIQNIQAKIDSLKLKIKLPFRIHKDAIKSLLDRFNKIKLILNKKGNVTHSMLFEGVLPVSYYYYEYISNNFSSSIEQMASIYYNDIDNYPKVDYIRDLISNYDFNSRKQSKISIKEIIQNFIKSFKVYDLLLSENKATFLNIIKYIIDISDKGIIDQSTEFDQSWYTLINEWVLQIISSCREDEIDNILERIFKILNIHSSHLNSDDLPKPIIYEIVEMVNRNENELITSKIIKTICILIGNGANINKLFMEKSVLDLINQVRNKEIFQVLVLNGASIVKTDNISDYYQSLNFKDKEELDYLFKLLSSVNSQVSWAIPFNHLFKKSVVLSNDSDDRLYFNNGISIDTRIISTMYTENSIQDSLHQIHLKFKPLLPSNHIVYNLFYKLLFEKNLPSSEFGILNGKSVLLKQSIGGKSLKEFNDSNLSTLNLSSVSKLIIMEILFYRINGGLNDFIVDSNDNIIPIENDNSFLPLSSYKNESFILPESCIFLLNQMTFNVPDDVKKFIIEKNMMELLKKLLKELQTIHCNWGSLFFNHFHNHINKDILNNIIESNSSILGVLFYKNQINKLYSRLIHLQSILKKSKVSHLSILKEMVSPFVSSKYENILQTSTFDSLEKRFEFLQSFNQNYQQLDILSILGIQDINTINRAFEINGDPNKAKNTNITSYEPSNSLEQLYDIAKQEKLIEPLFTDQSQFKIGAKKAVMNIKDFERTTIEYFLKQQKRHQDNSNDKQKYLIELLSQCKNKGKNLKIIKIKNNNQLQSEDLCAILPNSVVKLNISNCNNPNFNSFNQNRFSITSLKLNNANKIIVNNNSNLSSIRLSAPKLKSFSLSGNIRLEEFELQSPKLKYMNLSNGTLNKKSRVFESITKKNNFQKLKSIDISKNNKMDFMFKKDFNFCFNEFLKNNTQVIYDENIYKIGVLDSYLHNYQDNKGPKRNEFDISIKTLTDNEFIRDNDNETEKKNFNKLFYYDDIIVHIDYRLNYAFGSNEKISYGLIVFNPNSFDFSNLKTAYFNANRFSNEPFILFGISKLNGNNSNIQLLETLKQECNVIYKFNVSTLDDEKEIINQLLTYISNPPLNNGNYNNKQSNNNNNISESFDIINNYFEKRNNLNNNTNNNDNDNNK